MIRRIIQTAFLPAVAIVTLGLSLDSARANFQYVPNGGAAPLSDAPATNAVPLVPVMRMPVAPALPSSSGKTTGGAVINGFGNQVPLVIALRQIVPATYQFAYADGIDLGTLVNWKGGKSWHTVLNNVVSPLGLTAVERNMIIYIDRKPQ